MSKEDVIEVEGVVVEAMPNAMFLVEIQGGHRLLAHISGKCQDSYMCPRLNDLIFPVRISNTA